MAQVGGNRKTSSKLQKEHYKQYRLENRAEKNKIKKLKKHCRKFPGDKTGAKNLARILKDGYTTSRKRPITSGPNISKYEVYNFRIGIALPEILTPGEQLSRLLGIPLPKTKTRKPKKTKVTHKVKK